MADETDETADEYTYLGPKTVTRTNDDRPSRTEMEQEEDESDQEFRQRKRQESRGDEFHEVYLHESGWVKCVIEQQDEYGPPGHEEWRPPHLIEMIY